MSQLDLALEAGLSARNPSGDRPGVHHGMGRRRRQKLHIASGKPFEGLGYIGYNDVTGKYYSSWMDSNFAGIILAYSTYGTASHTCQFGRDGRQGWRAGAGARAHAHHR